MFGDSSENMQHEAVCVGGIDRSKLHAGIHQVSDESYIAGDAVQFGYDECGFDLLAASQSSFQDRPIIGLSSFDFNELVQKLPANFS
jgi:hypothetical protein